MFNNLYSEKTTKLVKLNLEIDPIENEENQRKTEARVKITLYNFFNDLNLTEYSYQ